MGRNKLPIFCGNGEQVIRIYGVTVFCNVTEKIKSGALDQYSMAQKLFSISIYGREINGRCR